MVVAVEIVKLVVFKGKDSIKELRRIRHKNLMKLFIYGSLMSPKVYKTIVGKTVDRFAATLKNYVRLKLREVDYPGLVALSDYQSLFMVRDINVKVNSVVGQVVDVDDSDLSILDKFEGDEYERIKVLVKINEEEIEAFCYLFKAEFSSKLTSDFWSYENDFLPRESEFLKEEVG
eukprot:augustus_masked-scaffold_13-processed-gene-9.6-mRNA-1 protein AED:1.00 eAED:1.00 QI:0/-1/0/0/-1/1/1/0/174